MTDGPRLAGLIPSLKASSLSIAESSFQTACKKSGLLGLLVFCKG